MCIQESAGLVSSGRWMPVCSSYVYFFCSCLTPVAAMHRLARPEWDPGVPWPSMTAAPSLAAGRSSVLAAAGPASKVACGAVQGTFCLSAAFGRRGLLIYFIFLYVNRCVGVDSLQALPKFHSFFTKSSGAYSALPVNFVYMCASRKTRRIFHFSWDQCKLMVLFNHKIILWLKCGRKFSDGKKKKVPWFLSIGKKFWKLKTITNKNLFPILLELCLNKTKPSSRVSKMKWKQEATNYKLFWVL